MFDKNGDGLISKNELAAVLKSIEGRAPTEKELKAMVFQIQYSKTCSIFLK